MRHIAYKRTISTLMLLVAWTVAWAQNVSVDVPSQVRTGQHFQLTYRATNIDVDNFLPPSIPAGLEIEGGPFTSSNSSFSVINGHVSNNSSLTVTFYVSARKPGTYTLPSGTFISGTRRIATKPVRITAVGASLPSQGGQSAQSGQQTAPQSTAAPNSTNLFIRATVDKQKVMEQEPVLVTYKVYTLVALTNLDGKMPEMNGFLAQEVALPQNKTFHVETLGGRQYKCVTWSQYLVYPQVTGNLEIPAITFHGLVSRGGFGTEQVDIVAPAVNIMVDPLPQKPADFSGGVGQFGITAQPSATKVAAGDPVTMRIVVTGTGNLKLVKAPDVKFPESFDVHKPRVSDRTKVSAAGVSGSMVFEIPAVPRKQGSYDIPPVRFTYYDPARKQYVTATTQPFHITVGPASGTSSAQDLLEDDIRDIHEGAEYENDGDIFYGGLTYWFTVVLLLLLFIYLLYAFRRRAMLNADIVGTRMRRADKAASKRMKKAIKLMEEGKRDAFFDEMLRALWGYVGDKLNLAATHLSRENVAERLADCEIPAEHVEAFLAALDECEYQRYAPASEGGDMSNTLDAAMAAITQIEEDMSGKGTSRVSAHAVITIILLLSCSIPALAVSKANADREYSEGNFQKAAEHYEEIVSHHASSDVYYNLGNAYYRLNDIPRAVLSYERAMLYSPGDHDIRANLALARSKTIDKFTSAPEMFIFPWWRSVVNVMSADAWGVFAIVSIVLSLLLLLLFLFSERIWVRKVGFFAGIAFILLFLLCNVCAYLQKQKIAERSGAIVMTPSASVKQTQGESSAEVCTIHEGTRVDIIDDSMHDWKLVRVADGHVGWISVKAIERI